MTSNKRIHIGYIYCITNKINNKKYIGQTRRLKRRFYEHIYNSRKECPKSLISKVIKRYGVDNFDFTELLRIESDNFETLKTELNNLEVFLIKLHNSYVKENGYNIEIGGVKVKSVYNPVDVYNLNGKIINTFLCPADAASYYNTNDCVVRKICNGDGRYYNYKNQIVFRWKGDAFDKYLTVNPHRHYDKITDSVFNPNKGCHVSIDVYDLNTEQYICTYESIAECGRSLNIPPSLISDIVNHNGKVKSTNGYVFRHVGDPLDKYDYKPHDIRKRVNQYSKDGEYIKTYESIAAAARELKKSTSPIYSCARKQRKTAHGFCWFYSFDVNQPDPTKIEK